MEVRPLQVHHENEARCLYGIHVPVLVSSSASPLNRCDDIYGPHRYFNIAFPAL